MNDSVDADAASRGIIPDSRAFDTIYGLRPTNLPRNGLCPMFAPQRKRPAIKSPAVSVFLKQPQYPAMVPPSRIERETSRATIWRSNQLS